MSSGCLLPIGLLLTLIATAQAQIYEYVLASDNACFYARYYDRSTIIKAPQNGTLTGVKLIFNGDTKRLKCGDNSGTSNWGCNQNGNNRSYTFLLKVVDLDLYYGELLYPIYDETNDVNVQLPGDTYQYDKCEGNYGCIYGSYYLDGLNANSVSNFTLINPSYNITANDTFWLQYSEGCCHAALPKKAYYTDNSGYTCATVYFVYEISTASPTIEPTNEPTIYPSMEPTPIPTSGYGVNICITYHLDSETLTNDTENILINATKSAIYQNQTSSIIECTEALDETIKYMNDTSITICITLVTCDAHTANILYADYESNLLKYTINIFSTSTDLSIADDAISLDLTLIGEAANPTVASSTSNGEAIGTKKPEDNDGFGLWYILVIICSILCFIGCVVIIVLKRRQLKEVDSTNKDLHTSLLTVKKGTAGTETDMGNNALYIPGASFDGSVTNTAQRMENHTGYITPHFDGVEYNKQLTTDSLYLNANSGNDGEIIVLGGTRTGVGSNSNSKSREPKFSRIQSTNSEMLYEHRALSIVSSDVANGTSKGGDSIEMDRVKKKSINEYNIDEVKLNEEEDIDTQGFIGDDEDDLDVDIDDTIQ